MTTADIRKITDTLNHCFNHCDDDDEAAMVGWVAEHLCDSIHRNQPNLDVSPLSRLIFDNRQIVTVAMYDASR